MMEVPFLDLQTQNRAIKGEILPLWEEILDCARFIGGKHILGFEEEFAEACDVNYCAIVKSGTDALRFIFLALDLKPGEEVITVPNTFIATTEGISQAGGKIVFVDIDPETYNMDPNQLEAAVTPRTRGIVPVHLYGQPADMDSILEIAEKYGLWVVEDACQAHLAEYKGKKTGSIGIAGAFSFYPGKNMGACGEAGAVTTNDMALANKVRIYRDHGQVKKYYHNMEGYNGRCDALQAAALRIKLKYLPEWNRKRREIANAYCDLLGGIEGLVLPKVANGTQSVYHLFVIQVDNRDEIASILKGKGIGTGLHYPIPLHLQNAYKNMNISRGTFPVAEVAAERILSLPIYPELTKEQVVYVCKNIIGCFAFTITPNNRKQKDRGFLKW